AMDAMAIITIAITTVIITVATVTVFAILVVIMAFATTTTTMAQTTTAMTIVPGTNPLVRTIAANLTAARQVATVSIMALAARTSTIAIKCIDRMPMSDDRSTRWSSPTRSLFICMSTSRAAVATSLTAV